MSTARYIDRETDKVRQQVAEIKERREKARQQQIAEGFAEGRAEARAWNERRLEKPRHAESRSTSHSLATNPNDAGHIGDALTAFLSKNFGQLGKRMSSAHQVRLPFLVQPTGQHLPPTNLYLPAPPEIITIYVWECQYKLGATPTRPVYVVPLGGSLGEGSGVSVSQPAPPGAPPLSYQCAIYAKW